MKIGFLSAFAVCSVFIAHSLFAGNREVVVSKNGKGDFTSITQAIDSVKNATEQKPVDIIVEPGEYFESPTTKNWVNIIGKDRDKCVLVYSRTSEQSVYKTHVIWATSNSIIKNLTLIGKDVKYCIHSDGGGKYKLTVENCILRRKLSNEHKGKYTFAFGIGLHANQNIIIRNCEIYGGRAAIFLHNWNNQRAPCSMTVQNCGLFGKEQAIYINCLGSGQTDFFVIHNSRLQAEKGVTHTNMDKKTPPFWKGKNEIKVYGSNNKLPKEVGVEIVNDANNKLSGPERIKHSQKQSF